MGQHLGCDLLPFLLAAVPLVHLAALHHFTNPLGINAVSSIDMQYLQEMCSIFNRYAVSSIDMQYLQ
jgi:hypothetical protein